MFVVEQRGEVSYYKNTMTHESLSLISTDRYDLPSAFASPYRIEPAASAGSAGSNLGDMVLVPGLSGSRATGFVGGYTLTRGTPFVTWLNSTLDPIIVPAVYLWGENFKDAYTNISLNFLFATSLFSTPLTILPSESVRVRYEITASIAI